MLHYLSDSLFHNLNISIGARSTSFSYAVCPLRRRSSQKCLFRSLYKDKDKNQQLQRLLIYMLKTETLHLYL